MTPTLFDPEDPKLTAYALGELHDPAERAEVELLLQQSPEASAAVEEIRNITLVLAAEYDEERRTATEPAEPLTPNIITLANRQDARRTGVLRPLLAAAAVLLIAGCLVVAWWKGNSAKDASNDHPVAATVDGAKPQGWGPMAEIKTTPPVDISEARRKLAELDKRLAKLRMQMPDMRVDLAQAQPAANSPTPGAGTLTLAPESMSGKSLDLKPDEAATYLSAQTESANLATPGQATVAERLNEAKELRDVQMGLNSQLHAAGAATDDAVKTNDFSDSKLSGFTGVQTVPEKNSHMGQAATSSLPPILGASGGSSTVHADQPVLAKAGRPANSAYAFDRLGRQYDVNGGLSGGIGSGKDTGVTNRSVAPAGSVGAAPPPAAAPQAPRVFKSETHFYRDQQGPQAQLEALASEHEELNTRAVTAGNRTGTFGIPADGSARPEGGERWAASASKPSLQIVQRDRLALQPPPASEPIQSQETFTVPNTDGPVQITKSIVEPPNTAVYEHRIETPFLPAKANPLSTFSIDVDTASYANVRRFIDSGTLPPPDAVRLEELINYFPYDYAPPTAESGKPFAIHLEAAACPWAPEHRLVRIGLKGREISTEGRPPSNLVFLLDVSGSMSPPERLPLIRKAMKLLTKQLSGNDHVAIVTYAGSSGLVLPSTPGDRQDAILGALDRLEAGGSTNGASGIALAYQVARRSFIKGGTNRVILATDGDFNVGITDQNDLVRLIQDEAKTGVFLSALGVGTDNYKDATMQKLADKGNGNYHYLDKLEEARKVLVEQMSGTLLTIAKDVKVQVEFNPATVGSYRLLGYEKRLLRKEDFNDDRVDAGEIGAGHSVTALYEVVPAGQPLPGETPGVDALRYGPEGARPVKEERVAEGMPNGRELLTVKLRHKAPDADRSERTYEEPLVDQGKAGDYAQASPDFKFAAAVAAFGLALRESPYRGGATLSAAVELAQEGKGADLQGYRAGFIELARRAQVLRDRR